MNNNFISLKEPLETKIKANCNSCKTLNTEFGYLGINTLVLQDQKFTKFLLEKYGLNILYLYSCGTCKTTMSLASLESNFS